MAKGVEKLPPSYSKMLDDITEYRQGSKAKIHPQKDDS